MENQTDEREITVNTLPNETAMNRSLEGIDDFNINIVKQELFSEEENVYYHNYSACDPNIFVKDEIIIEDYNFDETYMLKDNFENKPNVCGICKKEEIFLPVDGGLLETIKFFCDNCYINDFSKYSTLWMEKSNDVDKCDYCINALKNGCFIKKHNCTKLFWCSKCSIVIDHYNDISKHFYNCSLNRLPTHINMDTGQKSNSCDTSFKTLKTKDYLRKHLIFNTSRKFSCDICSKSYCLPYLKRHYLINHSCIKKYSCNICSKSFAYKQGLITHLRTHSGEKPYSCHVCRKNFGYKHYLTIHLRIHTGEKPYSCDICPRSFAQRSDLKLHYRTHLGEKPYSCDVCSKTFTKPYNLKTHSFTHTKKKPYSCDMCSKSFCRPYYLKRHYLTHTREKKYSCDICSESFSCIDNLKVHIAIHSDIKRYWCDNCCKSFSQLCYLRTHLLRKSSKRLESSEKYICDICSKSLSTKSCLAIHMRIHTGERPYSCGVCSRSFTMSNNLKRHILTIHSGQKTYP